MTNRDGGTGTSWAPCSLSLDGDDINWSLWPSISKETLRNPLEIVSGVILGLFVLFCWIFLCRIDEMMLIIVYLGEGNTCHAVFRNSSHMREGQFTKSAPSVIAELVEISLCTRNSGVKLFLKVPVFVLVDLFPHLQKEGLCPSAATYAKYCWKKPLYVTDIL